MDSTYQAMRTFADSWGLLYMVIIFVVVVIYALWPSRQKQMDDAANIPFKEDE